jgi:hypothetical protein
MTLKTFSHIGSYDRLDHLHQLKTIISRNSQKRRFFTAAVPLIVPMRHGNGVRIRVRVRVRVRVRIRVRVRVKVGVRVRVRV